MRRIDTPTSEPDKFGLGKNGFTDGDIFAAKPTTRINANWFDAHQEEQCNVVEGAGLVLDPDDHTQLLQAIRILAGRAITESPIDADTLDGVDSSAFARVLDLLAHIQNKGNPHEVTLAQLGGAPLSSPAFQGNPTAPTPATNDNDSSLATTAFVQAAILAALQSAGLGNGPTGSFGTNGWFRFGDLVLQWGRHAGGGGEGTGPFITFPIVFPNACLSVVGMDWARTGVNWQGVDCFSQVVSVQQGGFATFIQNPGSSSNYWEGFFWIAVGH